MTCTTWPFTQSLDPEPNDHTVIVESWTANASSAEEDLGSKATVAVLDGGGGIWCQASPGPSTTANRLEPDWSCRQRQRDRSRSPVQKRRGDHSRQSVSVGETLHPPPPVVQAAKTAVPDFSEIPRRAVSPSAVPVQREHFDATAAERCGEGSRVEVPASRTLGEYPHHAGSAAARPHDRVARQGGDGGQRPQSRRPSRSPKRAARAVVEGAPFRETAGARQHLGPEPLRRQGRASGRPVDVDSALGACRQTLREQSVGPRVPTIVGGDQRGEVQQVRRSHAGHERLIAG